MRMRQNALGALVLVVANTLVGCGSGGTTTGAGGENAEAGNAGTSPHGGATSGGSAQGGAADADSAGEAGSIDVGGASAGVGAGGTAGADASGGELGNSAGNGGGGASGAGHVGGSGGSSVGSAGTSSSGSGGSAGNVAASGHGGSGGSAGASVAGGGVGGSNAGGGGVGGSSPGGGSAGTAGSAGTSGAGGSGGSGGGKCVVYVNQNAGGDQQSGGSWATAKASLQAGLDAAYANSGKCDVWVASAIYVPTFKTDPFSTARNATLQLRPGIAVFGGFAGNEQAFSARDVNAHVTTLTGEIGTAAATDNLYHVVTSADGATLDGFTVTRGYGAAVDLNSGGGLVCTAGALTISHCTFTGNAAFTGGALWLGSVCSVQISDTKFSANQAITSNGQQSTGGAIVNAGPLSIQGSEFTGNAAVGTTASTNGIVGAIANSGKLELRDSLFANNTAFAHATINMTGGSLLLQGCTFTGNTSSGGAGVINSAQPVTIQNSSFSGNAGTYIVYTESAPVTTVDSSTFENNTATALTVFTQKLTVTNSHFTNNGGGATNGGAIRAYDLSIKDSTFSGNQAGYGGAVYASGQTEIARSTFTNNHSGLAGGALYSGCQETGCQPKLIDVVMSGNSTGSNAQSHGGAIYLKGYCPTTVTLVNTVLSGNTSGADGGAIANDMACTTGAPVTGALVLNQTTIAGNQAAGNGGAIRNTVNTRLISSNSIIWGNTAATQGDQLFNATAVTTAISNSDIQGTGFSGANGNIDQNPLFVSTTSLALQATSQCINAGSNASISADLLDLDNDSNSTEPTPFDLTGAARINGAAVDMGAYEHF